jgi:hypothetical protein
MVFDVDMFGALSGALAEAISTTPCCRYVVQRVWWGGGVVGPPMVRNWPTKGNVPFLCHLYDQVRSRAAWAAEMYSASAIESATVGCFELTEWMGAPAKVNTMLPVVEWRDSGNCA